MPSLNEINGRHDKGRRTPFGGTIRMTPEDRWPLCGKCGSAIEAERCDPHMPTLDSRRSGPYPLDVNEDEPFEPESYLPSEVVDAWLDAPIIGPPLAEIIDIRTAKRWAPNA